MKETTHQGRPSKFTALLLSFLFAAAGAFPAAVRGQQDGAAMVVGRSRRAGEAQVARSQQTQQPQQPQQQPSRPPASPQDDVDEDDVVRVETDLTNVIFTAQDKNRRFVQTLKKEDVRVFEDDVAQEVFTFQQQTDLPLSLAIVIDTSASQERTLPEQKAAAQAFLDAVVRQRKDEVAVVSFTGEATLEMGLTGNPARVRRAISNVEFVPPSGYIGGGVVVGTPPISGTNQRLAASTALWDAVWITSDEVLSEAPENVRRAMIILSDGYDTSSRKKIDEAIERALKHEVMIYTIGIGDSYAFEGVNEGNLRKLSERTGGRAYFPRSESDLRDAFAQIQRDLREQYLLAYSSTNKKRDGTYRRVRIEVVNPELRKQDLKLTYRQGYFASSDTGSAQSPRR